MVTESAEQADKAWKKTPFTKRPLTHPKTLKTVHFTIPPYTTYASTPTHFNTTNTYSYPPILSLTLSHNHIHTHTHQTLVACEFIFVYSLLENHFFFMRK
jgi:hypothetical protein